MGGAADGVAEATEAAEQAAEELDVAVPAWAVEAEEAEAGAGAEVGLQSARAAFGAGRTL